MLQKEMRRFDVWFRAVKWSIDVHYYILDVGTKKGRGSTIVIKIDKICLFDNDDRFNKIYINRLNKKRHYTLLGIYGKACVM